MRIESILSGIRIQGLFADFSDQRYFCKVITIVYLENIKSTSFLVGLYNINIVFRKL